MTHYNKYIALIKIQDGNTVADNISKTVTEITSKYIQHFNFQQNKTGLLLGNVQSGKTGHMLGVLASAADHDFEIFLVLTSDNTYLQQQTLTRALRSLDSMCVCGETDDIRFNTNEMRKPVVIVIKKNTNVLETWKNNLISSKFLVGRSIFIIDDESDAASLNTKINQCDISPVNRKITEIRKLANSSYYLQVTATPQSLFLQSEDTLYRPEFVYYFKPGKGYLGGEFFYNTSEPYGLRTIPRAISITAEEELRELLIEESCMPEGMSKALASFLISTAHLFINDDKKSSNFLIHPSVKIADHEKIVEKLSSGLNDFLEGIRDDDIFKKFLKDAWVNLQQTKTDLLDFNKCYEFISEKLSSCEINLIPMNSQSNNKADLNNGINIIVGGNAVGRGVTFPNLITTYYCRQSKKPQADTYWQHCRVFGYDRDPLLVRIFIPASLFNLFSELNNANNAMIEYIDEHGIEGIKLIYPKNINPTRKNIIDKDKLQIIAGGVNYFPNFPTKKNLLKLDKLLNKYSSDNYVEIADITLIKEIINLCHSEYEADWPRGIYINCIDSLANKNTSSSVLIVRTKRNISKETGTLLSPDDRKLGSKFKKQLVLTMYRINGESIKGWHGKPLWIPNIKFPEGNFFGIG